MKKLYLFLYILGFSFVLGHAQTLISAGTTVGDTGAVTWNTDEDPYFIQGDIFIEDLTILPGVEIVVFGEYKIEVTGEIRAIGTYQNPISFKKWETNPSWLGLHFTSGSSSESILSYCIIQDTKDQALLIGRDIQPLQNCTITLNEDHGIVVNRAFVTIENSIITENDADGIHVPSSQGSTLFIKNSIMSDNQDNGVYSTGSYDQIYITNSVIADNGQEGIICDAGILEIINSIVYYNSASITSIAGKTTANYNNIESITPFPGSGNKNQIPDFTDRISYKLNPLSPCVDSGDSSLAYSDIYFPPSIGELRNDMGAYGGPGAGKWIEQLSVDSSYIHFGSVSISDPKILPLLLYNETDSQIVVSDIRFAKNDSVYFSPGDINFPVPAQDSYSTEFTFSPKIQGDFNSEAIIENNKGLIKLYVNGKGLAPVIALSDSQLTYDTLTVFENSQQEITIYNNGQSQLIIYKDSLAINGPDSLQFSIDVPDDNVFIPVADSSNFTVTFNPKTAGNKQAYLNIVSNDPEKRIKQVGLSGISIKPVMSASDSALDFGNIEVDHDSERQITFYNSGIADLKIYKDELQITGSNPADFEIGLPEQDILIAPGDSAFITITFSPLTAGNKEAHLNVTSNDYDNSPLPVILTATAYTEPKIASITEIDFGTIARGSHLSKFLKIDNMGTATLIIDTDSTIITSGMNHFSLPEFSSDLEIAKGKSDSIMVRFSPKNTSFLEGTLRIVSNDPDDTIYVHLYGRGFTNSEPTISFSAEMLDFGQVDLGEQLTMPLFIKNVGRDTLDIISGDLRIIGQHKGSFSFKDKPQETIRLSFDDTLKVSISFEPLREGNKSAILQVASNDARHPDSSIVLAGYGKLNPAILPQANIYPQRIGFTDSIFVNQKYQHELTIKNTGNKELIIYRDSLHIGNSLSPFSFGDIPADIVIANGDSTSITIQFSPADTIEQNDTLYVCSNDLQDPNQKIPLNGKALDIPSASFENGPQQTSQVFTRGEDTTLTYEIKSVTPVDSVILKYKQGGMQTFSSIPFSNYSLDKWRCQIAGDILTERGLEYVVEAYHGIKSSTDTIVIPVEVPQINFPNETMAKKYQLISVPLDMKQQTLADLLVDDLQSYDSTEYRVFDYNPESERYVELVDLSQQIPPGKSLFLITRQAKTIDVDNSVSVSSAADYQINLKAGWNMIANPFAFPVTWPDNIYALRSYNGNRWNSVDEPISIMEPFEGYLVNVLQDLTINIAPEEASGFPKKHGGFLSEADWYLRISAQSENVSDADKFVGVIAQAMDYPDRYDYPEPPPVGTYLTVSLLQGQSLKKYSSDFRPPGKSGYTFDVKVESNVKSLKNLQFVPENLPENYDWTVISEQSGIILGKENISLSNDQLLKLVVGTQEYLNSIKDSYKAIPQKFSLKQNYPNPFNPQTTIAFELPRTVPVSAIVYNVLGKQVKILENHHIMEPGYHKIQWDGKNNQNNKVASGIYFLHFKAAGYTKTIKMIMNN